MTENKGSPVAGRPESPGERLVRGILFRTPGNKAYLIERIDAEIKMQIAETEERLLLANDRVHARHKWQVNRLCEALHDSVGRHVNDLIILAERGVE